jgi:cobalt-zinc-cadmium efflux system outer membrane protein
MIDSIVVASALLLATATTTSSPSEESLTLERALTMAFEKNPELRALAEDVSIARARLDAVGRLFRENPEIEASAGPRLRSGEDTSIDVEVSLEQPLEVFGQRGLRIDAAEQTLRASELRHKARKNELAFEVRAAFARALAAKRRVALANDIDALAQETLRAADERQRSGAASRIEVNSARVELGRAARDRSESERELAGAEAELGMLLALESVRSVDGDLANAAAREVKATVVTRAEIEAAKYEQRAAALERQSAARDAFPDLRAGATYAREEGANIILGTVAIELPFFERNQVERAIATGRERQAALVLEATEGRVARELELARRRYASAKAATSAYAGDVLRAMEENLSLAAEAYRAGKFDFLQLTLVRRETLDARRGYIESLEALNLAEAELLRAVGGEQ